ncbi:hypothetical protein Pla175_07220 [Pirellulimonas nuda]|uniref:Uncharacterized protein n=1 Tax=Pirellulimonas nuda TaxID=2528009 RepID=A0A518D799_9BACT|nr:hypothetical protein [Pirellulimonas nuda]QDU87363.1 hypothetical protein Pla175_07220 [Pirellulimonas nuda]
MFLLPLAQSSEPPHFDPQASWLQNLLGQLNGSDLVAVVLLSILCVTGVAIVITVVSTLTIKTIHRRSAETQLKREMLDRGFSVDEIVKLIEATGHAGPGKGAERGSGPQ